MDQERKIIFKHENQFKEGLMRYPLIIVVGLLIPLIYDDYQFFTHDYYVAIAVSICRTATLWIGSKAIVTAILTRIDFLKQTAKAIAFQAISLLTFTIAVISIEIFVLEHFTSFRYTFHEKAIFYEMACIITLFITTLYASTFFFIKWKENLFKAEKLEKANLEARYETLKNQINPHFLFNSLNTLTGMLDEGSAPQTYVQSLSEFLRYVLQTRDKEVVMLRDEVEFSKQYAFIQQKRFDKKLAINFSINEKYNHLAIPPLALQMLIENCIKHNIISKEKPLTITISVNDNQMLLIENNLQRKENKESTGVGLENIRNRYRYLGTDDILVSETSHKFTVGLPLLKVSL